MPEGSPMPGTEPSTDISHLQGGPLPGQNIELRCANARC